MAGACGAAVEAESAVVPPGGRLLLPEGDEQPLSSKPSSKPAGKAGVLRGE